MRLTEIQALRDDADPVKAELAELLVDVLEALRHYCDCSDCNRLADFNGPTCRDWCGDVNRQTAELLMEVGAI